MGTKGEDPHGGIPIEASSFDSSNNVEHFDRDTTIIRLGRKLKGIEKTEYNAWPVVHPLEGLSCRVFLSN